MCFDYGTRDLTLAIPDFFMTPSVVNEETRGTTVMLGVGYKESVG